MNNVVKLKISETPLSGLQYLANPLVVLLSYEECLPWFYSNYIQLICIKNQPYSGFLTFYKAFLTDIPWIEYQKIEKKMLIAISSELINSIIQFLNEGFYIMSMFDEFYVPDRNSYNRRHFIHDIMVYGYDLDNRIFHLLGYNHKRTYSPSIIGFEDFINAFCNTCDAPDKFVYAFKKRMDFKFDFDVNLVNELLYDYLYSKNTTERYRILENPSNDYDFGFSAYQYLEKYFEYIKNEVDNNYVSDIRPIHIFWEHKKCMTLRIKYMQSIGIIDNCNNMYNNFVHIENTMLQVRNMQIKYGMSKNKSILNRMITLLDSTKQMECMTIEKLSEYMGTAQQ